MPALAICTFACIAAFIGGMLALHPPKSFADDRVVEVTFTRENGPGEEVRPFNDLQQVCDWISGWQETGPGNYNDITNMLPDNVTQC